MTPLPHVENRHQDFMSTGRAVAPPAPFCILSPQLEEPKRSPALNPSQLSNRTPQAEPSRMVVTMTEMVTAKSYNNSLRRQDLNRPGSRTARPVLSCLSTSNSSHSPVLIRGEIEHFEAGHRRMIVAKTEMAHRVVLEYNHPGRHPCREPRRRLQIFLNIQPVTSQPQVQTSSPICPAIQTDILISYPSLSLSQSSVDYYVLFSCTREQSRTIRGSRTASKVLP